MVIRCIPTGMFDSNCYIVAGNEGAEAVVIDAGADAATVARVLAEHRLTAAYLVLTHPHIDHICELDKIREMTDCKVAIHFADAPGLSDPLLNVSLPFGGARKFRPADMLLGDDSVLKAGGVDFKIIHTPGHSPGGICVASGDAVFTGDTLFRSGIGRTDLPGGDYRILMDSIRCRLMKLADNTAVYPGHGAATTIGAEKLLFCMSEDQ